VVMLPLMDLSVPTVIVPLPDADVFTGGTSWVPFSMTFVPAAITIPVPPAKTPTIAMTTSMNCDFREIACI
jgi:hypothetical protein